MKAGGHWPRRALLTSEKSRSGKLHPHASPRTARTRGRFANGLILTPTTPASVYRIG